MHPHLTPGERIYMHICSTVIARAILVRAPKKVKPKSSVHCLGGERAVGYQRACTRHEVLHQLHDWRAFAALACSLAYHYSVGTM